MYDHPRRLPRLTAPAALAAALLAAPAPAQTPDYLTAKQPAPEALSHIANYKSGADPITLPGDKAATDSRKAEIDDTAKWLAYRLTDPKYRNEPQPGQGINSILKDARARYILSLYDRPEKTPTANEIEFVRVFGAALHTHLKTVLATKPEVQRINAVRMMSELAKSGYPDLADTFADLIAETKSGDGTLLAIQFYAFQGVKHLYACRDLDFPADPNRTAVKDVKGNPRERKLLAALIQFIERKPSIKPEETEELDGYAYVRREAVRALGACRKAAVYDDRNRVVSKPALTLLRVASNDGVFPPASASERLEAAVGFCNLGPDENLNLDYATHFLGRALVDLAVVKLNSPSDQNLPWKAAGTRLKNAVNAWRESAKKLTADRNPKLVEDLAARADNDLLGALEQGGAVRPNPTNLNTWLSGNPPKNKSLFKGDDAATVTPNSAGAAINAAGTVAPTGGQPN